MMPDGSLSKSWMGGITLKPGSYSPRSAVVLPPSSGGSGCPKPDCITTIWEEAAINGATCRDVRLYEAGGRLKALSYLFEGRRVSIDPMSLASFSRGVIGKLPYADFEFKDSPVGVVATAQHDTATGPLVVDDAVKASDASFTALLAAVMGNQTQQDATIKSTPGLLEKFKHLEPQDAVPYFQEFGDLGVASQDEFAASTGPSQIAGLFTAHIAEMAEASTAACQSLLWDTKSDAIEKIEQAVLKIKQEALKISESATDLEVQGALQLLMTVSATYLSNTHTYPIAKSNTYAPWAAGVNTDCLPHEQKTPKELAGVAVPQFVVNSFDAPIAVEVALPVMNGSPNQVVPASWSAEPQKAIAATTPGHRCFLELIDPD